MSWRTAYKATIHQLSVPSLYGELRKLENSVKHLRRSNEELTAHGEAEGTAGSWVFPVIQENEAVIAKQEEQVQLVTQKILEREAQIPAEDEAMETEIQSPQNNGMTDNVEINGGERGVNSDNRMDVDDSGAGVHL